MNKIFTTLVMTVVSLTGFAAVNPADYPDMELGKEYELHFKENFKGKYTPTEDGMMIEYGVMPVYTLSADGELELLETSYAGYIFGKQAWQFRATKGTTYFFADDFVMYDCKFSIDLSPAMKLVKTYPAAGLVYDPAAYNCVEMTLNQLATVEGATIKCGSVEAQVPVSVIGSNVGVDCNEQLDKWYTDSKIAGGEELTVILTGVRDMLDQPTENISVTYVAGHAPIRMVESKLPAKVLSWYANPEEDSKAVFTFSGPIQAKPMVHLCYAPIELGYEYIDTLATQVSGNILTIDLAGKRRTSEDMSTSGRTDSSIYLQLLNLKDDAGQVVWSPGQGTIGTFLYSLPFKNIKRLDITSEFTPAPGAKLADTNEIKIYFNCADHLKYSGVKFAAGDLDMFVSMDQISVEQITATEVELTVPVPAQFKTQKNVVVTLTDLTSDEGYDHTSDISALYNGFVVNFCNIIANSSIAQIKAGFPIKAETNLVAGEKLTMTFLDPKGTPMFGPAELTSAGAGVYNGVVTRELTFDSGLVYTLRFDCAEGSAVIPFKGASVTVEYSPNQLVSIDPANGSEIAPDQVITVTFDGMVEVAMADSPFKATPVDPADGLADVWTFTLSEKLTGEVTLSFTVTDTDELPVQGNDVENHFVYTFKVTDTGLISVELPTAARIYDLQGRPAPRPTHGLYIINGKATKL